MAFKTYADYYDIFYKAKDYRSECRFLKALFQKHSSKPIKTILDLGCGTGNHLVPLLQSGFKVSGVDNSSGMLRAARKKIKGLNLRANLSKQNLKNFKISGSFDAVICMFSVIDYLTDPKDVLSMLKRVHGHLKPGGIFIFDFWNAQAVETRYSRKRSRIYRSGNNIVERHSETKLNRKNKLCEVSYRCLLKSGGRIKEDFQEKHILRYFSINEMKGLLSSAKMDIVGLYPFMNLLGKIRANTWDVTVVAQKI